MFAAAEIKEHMEVVGADGRHVGTVDQLDGEDQIKLARLDSSDGEHHFIAIDLVDRVDDKVYLKVSAQDAQFQLH